MNFCTKDQLIGFEKHIQELFEAGELPFLIHLSGGNEEQLIEIFREVKPGDWVFSTHRNHYHYLLSGGAPAALTEMIRDGKSMFVFGRQAAAGHNGNLQCNFLSSSILAGTCGIAAGVAWAIREVGGKEKVWCFVGDGAEDEGHLYEAVRLVHGRDLPCKFIIEDNDRSVSTTKEERRGHLDWDSIQWPKCCVKRYTYTPTYPHGGTGCKQWVQFKPEIVERFKA